MQRPDIEGIKARLAESTDGAWSYNHRLGSLSVPSQAKHCDCLMSASDVHLLGNARQDMAGLLAYIEELEQLVEQLEYEARINIPC